MTFTHEKKAFAVFVSFGCKVVHWGIILVQGLFCHPLITTQQHCLDSPEYVYDILYMIGWSGVYGVNFNWDVS